MTIRSAFAPHYGSNQNLAPGTSTNSVTIGLGDRSVLLQNSGVTNVCYIKFGNSANGAVTATIADLPILPNRYIVISKPPEFDTMAYISPLGTTLSVITGEGGMT